MALIPGAVGSAPSFPAGSGDVQFYSPSISTDLILDTSYAAGRMLTFINSGTANLVLKALDGSVIRTVYPQTDGRVVPIQNSPAVTAHWAGIGEVISDWINGGAVQIVGGGATKGGTTRDIYWWQRRGDTLKFRMEYRQTSVGTAGSGLYVLHGPAGFVIDGNKIRTIGSTAEGSCGYGQVSGGFSSALLDAAPNGVIARLYNDTVQSDFRFTSAANFGLASLAISFSGELPITGWTATKG